MATSQAQVTYSEPTSKDLDRYFYGGIQVVELNLEGGAELHYQLVDARDMTVLSENTYEHYSDMTARFALTVAQHVEVECSALSSDPPDPNIKYGKIAMSYQFAAPAADGELVSSSGSGDSSCIDLPRGYEFNWGHWTDIATAGGDEFERDTWVPVTAFVPNYYSEGGFQYAPAEEWFVLLIFASSTDGVELNLTQADFVDKLRQYGIDPYPENVADQ